MTLKLSILLSLLTLLLLGSIQHWSKLQISDPSLINGWIFFTFLVLLCLYYLRKKLNVLPLGKMEHWLAFHLVCATGFVVTYSFHIGLTLPSGLFNFVLWGSNLTVIITGLAGLFLSKTLPLEIYQIGEKPVQEMIPALKNQLINDAENTLLGYLENHYSEPLHRIFNSSIHPFLLSSDSLLTALIDRHKTFKKLVSEIEDLEHFVGEAEQNILASLKQMVKRKHHLGKQARRQSILRHWLFLHTSSVVVLLVCIVLHIFAIYGFSMGGA